MKRQWVLIGKISVVVLSVFFGLALGQLHSSRSTVLAQDSFTGITNCVTTVSKSWGEFKGASAYGLAFQDKDGNLRFVLHPSCSSLNSPAEPPAAPIDLMVQRR